jgi:hypothetical protein
VISILPVHVVSAVGAVCVFVAFETYSNRSLLHKRLAMAAVIVLLIQASHQLFPTALTHVYPMACALNPPQWWDKGPGAVSYAQIGELMAVMAIGCGFAVCAQMLPLPRPALARREAAMRMRVGSDGQWS